MLTICSKEKVSKNNLSPRSMHSKINYCNLNLSLLYINFQCLSNKISLLDAYCQKYKSNILHIDELWLINDKIKCIYVNDFTHIASFYRSDSKVGGTTIFAENSIPSEACSIPNINGHSVKSIIEYSALKLSHLCLIEI